VGDTTFRFDSGGRPEARSGPAASQGAGPSRPAPTGDDAAELPVLFAAPWAPLTCPRCHGIRTFRPILYGPAAMTPAAQQAAERGEVVLGGLAMGADGANAQCTSGGTRVRIVPTTPE
jgi:hypothetical protein